MTTLWNVDLHNHTCWSKDCVSQFQTIIRLCQKRGVDRIAITDHNTAQGALEMQRIAPELVLVGEEIKTTQGELLAFFVRESVPAGLTPQEAIHRLRDQGAVISVSHPFDRLRNGAWREDDLRRIVDQIDAIEIFNARCLYAEDNEKAIHFAQEHHLPGTVGSDAHIFTEYGRAMTRMRPFANDPEDFLDALRSADYVMRLSAAYVHLGSKIARWSKKLGLQPRLWDGG